MARRIAKALIAFGVSVVCMATVCCQPVYNKNVLEEMIAFNGKMKTDRLIVAVGDTVISDTRYRGREDEKYLVYSITKLFSGIAVGILIDKGFIESAEIPVSDFFEEWKNDTLKRKVRLRHILQHTSGLEAGKGSRDIYSQDDFVKFALSGKVSTKPGAQFFYNNKAVNIISGVVTKLTGKTLEQFIKENVFDHLGINNYEWKRDGAGNTWGMDGLRIGAGDLVRIGQMLSNYGEWKGRRILSRNWCELMFQLPLLNAMKGIGGYGMCIRALFFREEITIPVQTVSKLRDLGLKAELADRLLPLSEKGDYKYFELGSALKEKFTEDEVEEITGFSLARNIPVYQVSNGNFVAMHGGEYGLLLCIYPAKKTSVVRYLGEKWGRQKKDDGSEYRYLIDNEIIAHMIRLVAN